MSGLPARGEYARFIGAAQRLGVTVVADELLASHTTFRIGGPADLYAAVSEREQLERLATLAVEHGIPTTVLGGGSNVLVSDAGVRGLVIANQTRSLGAAEATGGEPASREVGAAPAHSGTASHGLRLVADSGVLLAGLARWAIKAGLSGLEWAVSVPGTVGGAVIGNAGAHGGQVADNLAWALVAYPGQGHRTIAREGLAFGYRTSILKQQLAGEATVMPSPIVLAAAFDVVPGEASAITERANAFLAKRRATQPVDPSAGSVFRNPPGDHAGRLIEAVGLKGHRVGDAEVSPRHANFIVNVGKARAADVLALIDLTRRLVFEHSGIELMPEIIFMGDWDRQPPYAPVTRVVMHLA